MSNVYAMFKDGLAMADEGRAQYKQSQLGKLASQGYTAPREQRSGLLGQMAAIDPAAARQQETSFGNMDDDLRKQLSEAARAVMMAPPEQRSAVYKQYALPIGQQLGLPVRPEWDESLSEHFQALAGVKGQEEYTLSAGAKRFRGDKLIAEAPFAPTAAQLVNVPDGQGGTIQMEYDPRTRQFAQPQYSGAPQPQGMTGGGAQVMNDAYKGAQLDPVNDFQQFGQMPGVQVSSLRRTPERNAAVGGTGRSFHLSGEAGDFVVPDAQKATFIANARAKGYQAIDEGDHVHVEPPGRGMTRSQFGQGQRMGYTPPKTPARSAAVPKASVVQQRSQMVRELEASGVKLSDADRRSILTTGKPPAATATKTAQAQSMKPAQLANVDRGLVRIEQAIRGLDGSLINTGPIDQLIVGKMPAGQELEAAVGSIQESLLALTRVPGMGAQSDLEAKIAGLKFPSLGMDPAVNRRTLKQLKEFVTDLKSSMAPQAGAPAPSGARQVKRTGTANGRKVFEYTDGTIDYAD